jgi:hypothetical protein
MFAPAMFFPGLPPTPSGQSPSAGCAVAAIVLVLTALILGGLGWFMVSVLLEIRRAQGA